MPFRFRFGALLAGLLLTLPISLSYSADAADDDMYVVLTRGQACSIGFIDVNVSAFRILIPSRQLSLLTDDPSIANVHVCECALIGGDQKKCALDAITKAARRVQLTPSQRARLNGGIFVLVTDPGEFAKLYASLRSTFPFPEPNAAWSILHDTRTEGVAVPPPPSSVPPPPGPPAPMINGEGADKDSKKRSCEVSPNICFDTRKSQASVEYEVKCEGIPPITISTDGKAGFKLGPLEVSVSLTGDVK